MCSLQNKAVGRQLGRKERGGNNVYGLHTIKCKNYGGEDLGCDMVEVNTKGDFISDVDFAVVVNGVSISNSHTVSNDFYTPRVY